MSRYSGVMVMLSARAPGPRPGDRGGRRGRGPEQDARARPPGVRPHRVEPDQGGGSASVPLIRATRSRRVARRSPASRPAFSASSRLASASSSARSRPGRMIVSEADMAGTGRVHAARRNRVAHLGPGLALDSKLSVWKKRTGSNSCHVHAAGPRHQLDGAAARSRRWRRCDSCYLSRAPKQLPLTECSGTTRPTGYPRRRVPYCAGLPKEAT